VLRRQHLDRLDQGRWRFTQGRWHLAGVAEERRRRRDLGKPNTDAGQQAKESIKTIVNNASGVSGFASAAATIGTTLATMEQQVTTTVTNLQQLDASAQGELRTAFERSSDCQALSASTSTSA
jgi:hypothetical protein